VLQEELQLLLAILNWATRAGDGNGGALLAAIRSTVSRWLVRLLAPSLHFGSISQHQAAGRIVGSSPLRGTLPSPYQPTRLRTWVRIAQRAKLPLDSV
jgi:hypothetical protein